MNSGRFDAADPGREMTAMRYAARKLLTLLVTMVVVSFLTFAAFDLISGDPATAMLGTQATPETVAALRAQLGLDAPLQVRYSPVAFGAFSTAIWECLSNTACQCGSCWPARSW